MTHLLIFPFSVLNAVNLLFYTSFFIGSGPHVVMFL